MKTEQAPHEKLIDEEIKSEIEKLLSNHLNMKKKWNQYETDFQELFDKNEEIIFKLRRHFSPETVSIMTVSISELADMMGKSDE